MIIPAWAIYLFVCWYGCLILSCTSLVELFHSLNYFPRTSVGWPSVPCAKCLTRYSPYLGTKSMCQESWHLWDQSAVPASSDIFTFITAVWHRSCSLVHCSLIRFQVQLLILLFLTTSSLFSFRFWLLKMNICLTL